MKLFLRSLSERLFDILTAYMARTGMILYFGGGSGSRDPTQEEKDLWKMQTRVAEQGIQGRDAANKTYQGFSERGRDMGSIANQNQAAGQFMQDSTAAFGNAQRMQDTRMASMGVNPGDPRFTRGRDMDGVAMAGQTAAGMNSARAGARAEGMKLEGAGAAGLAGFDPSSALNGLGSSISSFNNRAQSAANAEAQGYGNLAQGVMYGLTNGQKIKEGAQALGLYADGGYVQEFAEGGIVQGIQRFANGGNVYQQAMAQGQEALPNLHQPQSAGSPGMSPRTASDIASSAVNKVATSMGLGQTAGAAAGTEAFANAVGKMGGDSLGALINSNAGWAGVDAAGGAAAAEGAATAAAEGGAAAAGAGAGALGAIGTALPWIGGALAIGSLLGLKDGGSVPGNHAIGGRAEGGRAENPNGGKVSGPGGPKDDKVMARLSPGEFVLPVGAVRKFGLDRLEKMRQAGLEFERQHGIH